MRPLHQRDSGNKGRRRRAYLRSGGLDVENLDTSPALVLRGRTRNLLIPKAAATRGDSGSEDDVAMSAHVP